MSDRGPVLVALDGISKSFGSTRAVQSATIEVHAGELVGLIGHNGAGKSTTMRVINGEHQPDAGRMIVRGEEVTSSLTPGQALELGIRSVPQELELPGNLQLREAAIFAGARAVGAGRGWRRRADRMIMAILGDIFPGHGMSAEQRIEYLSISQRQMLAVALSGLWAEGELATCLVLDEPTSSLDAFSAESLYRWLRREAQSRGLAVLVSTHKLHEVIRELDRAYVMADGVVVAERSMAGATRGDLVSAMHSRGLSKPAPVKLQAEAAASQAEDRGHAGGISISSYSNDVIKLDDLRVANGEVVGLGGLEGQGQKAVLRAIFAASRLARHHSGIRVSGRLTFVSGDRATEGVFRQWSVERNLSVSALGVLSRFGWIARDAERSLAETWRDALRVRGELADGITSLSGGTQQKVLVGRALADAPDVLLLDDPTRGVDEETKLEIHAIVSAQAKKGTAVLWYSTEAAELKRCQRVCVMLGGRVTDMLLTKDLDDEAFESRLVGASFAA
ncbi:ATP-binding cassette domain-containing protein [Acidisoma sp. S159]|jgi:ribose transport system ATP-binding protein|uniref:ATP-binding cassette domain-containing protein n=1 Tax=Acidisoma sp. S159 TaxID=1747225 RepID=UPI00131CE8BA|nr:ATP-binding cassette domain-containing protein [Acidisoma sp. S159]